jgi:hypothetical protein
METPSIWDIQPNISPSLQKRCQNYTRIGKLNDLPHLGIGRRRKPHDQMRQESKLGVN